MDVTYTDDVLIQESGIHIAKPHAYALSIEDGTKVWGVVLGPRLGTASYRKGANAPTRQLLLTPIPLDAWPVCFQLRMQIGGRAGALAKALRALTDENVNVVHVDVGPGGESFSSVDLVCELPRLRQWAADLKRKAYEELYQGPNAQHGLSDYRRLSDHAAVIAARVYSSMQLTMWKLRLRHELGPLYRERTSTLDDLREEVAALIDKIEASRADAAVLKGKQGFLDSRFLYGKDLFSLYDYPAGIYPDDLLRSLLDDEFAQELKDQEYFLLLKQAIIRSVGEPEPSVNPEFDVLGQKLDAILRLTRRRAIRYERRAVSGSLNAGLLQAWMRHPDTEASTFRSVYDARSETLVPYADSKSRFRAGFLEAGVSLPYRATASLSPGAKYLRATLVGEAQQPRRFRIEIRYQVSLTTDKASSSEGLFSSVASALEDFPARIIRFGSVLMERPSETSSRHELTERGKLILVGFRSESAGGELTDQSLHDLKLGIVERFERLSPGGRRLRLEMSYSIDEAA